MSTKLISDALLNSLVQARIEGVNAALTTTPAAAKAAGKYKVTARAMDMGPNKVMQYQLNERSANGHRVATWSLCANPSNCGVIDMYYLSMDDHRPHLMEIIRAVLFAETKAFPGSPNTDTGRAMLAVTYNVSGNEGYATYKLVEYLCDNGWGNCVTRSPIAFYNPNSSRCVATALIMRKPVIEGNNHDLCVAYMA